MEKVHGHTTSEITKPDDKAPGSGTVRLLDSTVDVTAYNYFPCAIASGKHCQVARIHRDYWIVAAEC